MVPMEKQSEICSNAYLENYKQYFQVPCDYRSLVSPSMKILAVRGKELRNLYEPYTT
jgi:hypothetical protein